MAEAVLARLTQQLDDAADKRYQAYSEKIRRLTDQSTLRAEADLQAAANWSEDQMVVSAEQKLAAVIERLQASQATVDKLLTRFEALQQNSKSVAEDTDQKIRADSRRAIESARQEVAGALREQVERTSATLEGECQALVLDAVTRTVSSTLVKADQHLARQTRARLSQAYAELKSQQEQMMAGVGEQVNQIVTAATTSLAAKFEAMAEEIGPLLRREMEEALQDSAGNLLAQSAQSLQEQAELVSRETLASLQQTIERLRAGALDDLQRQFDARSGIVLENLQAGAETLARELQANAAQSLAEKLQRVAGEMADASTAEVRGKIQDETRAATEAYGKEANERLSAMADEFFASSSRNFQARLRRVSEAQLDALIESAPDRLRERLNRLTQAAGVTLVKVTGNELQKLAGTLFESSSQTLRQEVAQLTEKLQVDLKTLEATLAEQSRQQLLATSRSTIQALNQEAMSGVEKFRARLQASAQESHEESLRQLEANFQEALKKLRAALYLLIQESSDQAPQS